MLNINDLRNGVVYKDDNQIFQVLSFEHTKMGRGSGNVRLKVKNLKSGAILEKSFITGARVEEADVENKKVQYLYQDENNYCFMDPKNFEQFFLSEEAVGEQTKFFQEGLEVNLMTSGSQALTITLPNNLIYRIKETGPAEKGNTVSNVYKSAVLDNGLEIKVPMFMKAGDKIRVDTRTTEYVERVKD